MRAATSTASSGGYSSEERLGSEKIMRGWAEGLRRAAPDSSSSWKSSVRLRKVDASASSWGVPAVDRVALVDAATMQQLEEPGVTAPASMALGVRGDEVSTRW